MMLHRLAIRADDLELGVYDVVVGTPHFTPPNRSTASNMLLIASGRDTPSRFAQASILDSKSGWTRTWTGTPFPVAGRPIFFLDAESVDGIN